MTAQSNARIRFRRAIERRALWMAEDAARELPDLTLELPDDLFEALVATLPPREDRDLAAPRSPS